MPKPGGLKAGLWEAKCRNKERAECKLGGKSWWQDGGNQYTASQFCALSFSWHLPELGQGGPPERGTSPTSHIESHFFFRVKSIEGAERHQEIQNLKVLKQEAVWECCLSPTRHTFVDLIDWIFSTCPLSVIVFLFVRMGSLPYILSPGEATTCTTIVVDVQHLPLCVCNGLWVLLCCLSEHKSLLTTGSSKVPRNVQIFHHITQTINIGQYKYFYSKLKEAI